MAGTTLRMTRRQLLRAALAVGGAALGGGALAGCTPEPAGGRDDAPVTIGFVPIACASPLLAADGLGLFERHGVRVRLRKFSGWADLWTAYAVGEIDVAHMLSPMPVALDAGVTNAARPTRIVFTQNTNGQAVTLGARHHPGVRGAADLEGMTIGIPFEYSVHALLLRDYLTAHGLDPVADLELRLLRPADMIAQMSVGTIDGFIGPEPFLQRSLATGSGRVFELTKDMWDGHPCCAVAMAKDFLADAPGPARRIVAALEEAARFVNNPEHAHRAAPLLGAEAYLNQKPEFIEPALRGSYLSWGDEEIEDPDYLRFGDPTSYLAIAWMATQIARFGLGGGALELDDAAVAAVTDSVLPADGDRDLTPVEINGTRFDPARPTAAYRR
ncbi:nitrate ABC transporter substrate-binding protein [Corynebacterium frankenforstense DSM 45800]|uniref:Nitrate ABC transporter substrate-binding protein n=1 Tax=Corynebacterium frankenforstense DSM 45800 TaxID=1437875 RepID=A0A1L7CU76_9CORY|nr:ABC transporter substrate-binding protein [Corynebacterium frankenforstense]APT89412.1 nitrate ABC transporter substrate-binding protein [Corynebacterium frankenforstense DSM 45800]